MSVLFDAHEVGLNTKSQRVPRTRRKEDDLLVFGYACKLFEDSEKASAFDPEKHLISWMGDETLRIDRYDARLYFTDKAQFTTKPSELASTLTLEEEEMERQCDEERYMDLNRNMEEYEIQQEEEMKRFQQALSEDGAYNSVGFTYPYESAEISHQYPKNLNGYKSLKRESDVYQVQQARVGSHLNVDTSGSPPPIVPVPGNLTPPLFQEPEPFVPPKELEIPDGMEIPETAKMQAIIERTAVFVAKQGTQMEILVKAKQSGNPQFDFLLMDNWLNPYYKHVLKYVTEGKFVPETPQPSTVQAQEETKESDNDDSEDDSDGEYELHPLLQASLHKRIKRSQPSSASSSPLPQTLGNKFSRTFAPVTSGLNSTAVPHDQDGVDAALSGEVPLDEAFDYSMWYPQDDLQGLYVSSAGYLYHPPVAHLPSVADMIPPPPPPPGEGPLEEEWLEPTSSVPPLPPPPPPPVPPGLFVPETIEIPGVYPPPPSLEVSTLPLVPQPIIPPPPDLQPIVDKLAIYVAKNGPDFESIIIAKNDPRFEFLDPWNTHHSYYILKKQEAQRRLLEEKAEKAQEDEKFSSEASKGPISFSIKAKDTKKPKIEYRTSVIYKQSCEQGESDEETDVEGSGAEGHEKEEVKEKLSDENTGIDEQQQVNDQISAEEDSTQQMDSIKAAEIIAQNLESESRDKQLQLERRRKASLFISMLKKTNPTDELEANESPTEGSVKRSRKFMETRCESPLGKKSRTDSDTDNDDDDDLSMGGVGAPSPGSIRVTQDLMAKVLAASKNK